MRELRIRLPKLHPAQRKMRDEAQRNNVACMGRRFGKTKFGVDRLFCGPMNLLDGYPAGWFAPSSRYVTDVWDEIVSRAGSIISATDKREGRIRFITGGWLDFWAMGEDKEVARGRRYARVIIDEAAHIRYLEEAWERAVSPTLTDFRGEAWFISTPNGRNYFADLYDRHAAGDVDWMSWQMPTAANPFIDPREIETRRRELPELVFQQEYLAQFVDFGGGMVKREHIRVGECPPSLPCVMGVDLAISEKEGADYTAIAVLSRLSDGPIYVRDVMRARMSFHATQEAIKSMAARWKPRVIAIEATQYQAAAVQELLRTTTLTVSEVKPDRDKVTRFQPLASRYEQGLVYHEPTLPREFEAEMLSFPAGEHDDMVDAAAHAFLALGYGGAAPNYARGGVRPQRENV